MVVSSHTISYPKAVVIESLDAHLAFFTVLGSIVASNLALTTDMLFGFFMA